MSQIAENVCNEETFSRLFRKLSRELHNFLYYKFGADNNPKDLVQEAFRKLWENCHKVTEEKSRSFLYTVASNQALNDIARKRTSLKYNAAPHLEMNVESPEYLMEVDQYHKRVQTALEELSEEHRITLMLNRVEDKTHQEIADLLGISKKAVEKRIYTALKTLREKIGKI